MTNNPTTPDQGDERRGKAARNLTPEIVREALDYDHESGVMRWRSDGRRWKAGDIAGTMNIEGYLSVCVKGFGAKLHQVCWLHFHGYWPTGYVDHINGNKLDNRIANLRDVSNQVNCQNIFEPRKGKRSGLPLGVILQRAGRTNPNYGAQIKINQKSVHIGSFSTPEAAHEAYLEAKRRYHKGSML